ncbi:PDZ domain-containing protein [Clostridium sp.]|uniref:PDZ domain-containing protein n=1 Tax=Clostridium sp. TaxID=1506 RepID=UPI00321723AB
MEIIYTVLRNVAFAVVDPYSSLVIISMGIFFYMSNRKIVAMQKIIMGESRNTTLELTISQIVLGILAGAILSIILTYLGVVFNSNSSIFIIFILSSITLVIPSKYLSIAYTATIFGIISIVGTSIVNIFDMPIIMAFDTNIISLIALVGSIYFVKGLLTVIDGSRGAIPIFAKKDKNIIGGFAMKRSWIFPIALLMLFKLNEPSSIENLIEMPKWWPILKGTYNLDLMKGFLLALLPLYAVTSINTVTFTRSSKSKAKLLGTMNIVYGLLVLSLSVFARIGYSAEVIALIMVPVLYEIMLKIDFTLEMKNTPKYITTDEGLMILDVVPNSPANNMGIESGDLILEANGINLAMENNVLDGIKNLPLNLIIKIRNTKGEIKDMSYTRTSEEKKLGVIFVPKIVPDKMLFSEDKINVKDIMNKFKDDDEK